MFQEWLSADLVDMYQSVLFGLGAKRFLAFFLSIQTNFSRLTELPLNFLSTLQLDLEVSILSAVTTCLRASVQNLWSVKE